MAGRIQNLGLKEGIASRLMGATYAAKLQTQAKLRSFHFAIPFSYFKIMHGRKIYSSVGDKRRINVRLRLFGPAHRLCLIKAHPR